MTDVTFQGPTTDGSLHHGTVFCDYGTLVAQYTEFIEIPTKSMYSSHVKVQCSEVLNFAQSGLVNSSTFQYLWNEIQGFSQGGHRFG